VRSEVTIDVGALRRNVARLRSVLGRTELWAVVKADAYGHGAADLAGVALDAGATALCVATVAEGLSLRRVLPGPRILVLGPTSQVGEAREARLELVVGDGAIPEDVPVHVKLDTGMGRFGFAQLPPLGENVVGVMTHLATADSDPTFAERQLERFRSVGAVADTRLTLHAANSAAALRLPGSRLDAARCGIALYGLSPFGTDPAEDGLEPVLGWRSELAQVKRLDAGESTGYGRTYVAPRPTWIGLVPVGYGDGFPRSLTGTQVLVAGRRRTVVGTISMDSFAVELDGPLEPGTPVTLIGDGLRAEEHARIAGTITYELACGIGRAPDRTSRSIVDG
jgi:alanine racemase